ncbi:MAG: hypothetical protein ACK481_07110 [Candidatus Melainabacteria bacterium]
MISIVLASFGAFAMSECGVQNPFWFSCKKDSDCVVISDPCGWPTATSNNKFKNDAKNYNYCRGAVLDCVQYLEVRDGRFVAKCIKGRCSAIKN